MVQAAISSDFSINAFEPPAPQGTQEACSWAPKKRGLVLQTGSEDLAEQLMFSHFLNVHFLIGKTFSISLLCMKSHGRHRRYKDDYDVALTGAQSPQSRKNKRLNLHSTDYELHST